MSYQVLARRWRPQTFDEVTGQPHVTVALRNAIRLDRVPHAVLLTGPRGVGKTTLARILARCLNCEKGPTDTPCGSCVPCREIAAGTSTDVQEVDAASRTSVDDVRELIEAVRYAPSPGKHRIFVVDEVHMLSTPAFNALLKTLEEPPPRSLFVFATTNPEKIPFTVVSRCQRYDLRRLATPEVVARLREIAGAEGLHLSETALLAIARESEGSMRDALTLLDQVIAYGGTEVSDAQVAEVLDLVDRRLLAAILEACVNGDPAAVLEACARAAEAGIDAKRLGGELLRGLRDLVVLRVAPNATGLVEGSDAELAELRALAERCEPLRLRRMFRALLREQEDLAWASEPHAVLEMALVRLATLGPGEDVQALLARLDALERRLGDAPPPGSSSGGEAEPPKPGSPEHPARTPRASAPPARDGRRASAADGATAQGESTSQERAPEAEAATVPERASLPVVFDRLREHVRRVDRGLFAALQEGRLLEHGDGRLRVAVPQAFAAQRLRRRAADLEAIAGALFGGSTRIEIEGPEPEGPNGPARTSQNDLARHRRQEALAHPSVNATLEILGGEVLEIRPLEAGR